MTKTIEHWMFKKNFNIFKLNLLKHKKMGTLRIHGTIDIKQFWPNGSSDADTTKIKLVVGEDSFEYKEDDEKDFSKTNAFKDAISKGQGSKPVINTSKRDGTQTITVRLQGVDAPELHYRAAPLKKTNDVSISSAYKVLCTFLWSKHFSQNPAHYCKKSNSLLNNVL